MSDPNKSNNKAIYVLIGLVVLVMIGIIVMLFIIRSPLGNISPGKNTVLENTQTSPSTETRKDVLIAPDAQNKPWNGGEDIKRDQVVEVASAGSDINSNMFLGGTGIMYEDASKKTTLIFIRKDSLAALRATCEGGGVKNPERAPEIKGSFVDDMWGTEVMNEKEINGVPCYVKESINVEKLPYQVVGYTIFIGFSKQGNAGKGWDKWVFDQYFRAFNRRIPGTVSNGGGGANCWALPL